jgi:hypothetical protein
MVEYSDWAELVSLAYKTQHAYLQALYWSLEEEIENNSILQSRLFTWSRAVSHSEQNLTDVTTQGPVQGPEVSAFVPVLTNTSLKRLRATGGEILQEMTKRCGGPWCARINNFMCKYLLRVAHMHCNSIVLNSTYTHRVPANVQYMSHRQNLFDLMREEVAYLFSGGLPMCLCSDQGFVALILSRNFCILPRSTPCSRIQMQMHPLDDLWSPDSSPSVVVLSHAQFRTMLLTLGMGTHARLGRNSVLQCLLPDLLQLICRKILLQDHTASQLFHQEEMWLF